MTKTRSSTSDGLPSPPLTGQSSLTFQTIKMISIIILFVPLRPLTLSNAVDIFFFRDYDITRTLYLPPSLTVAWNAVCSLQMRGREG